jgi:hypothetical protein
MMAKFMIAVESFHDFIRLICGQADTAILLV